MLKKILAAIVTVLQAEPALLGGALAIAGACLAKFGFHVTSDQLLAWSTVLITVVSLWVRGRVSPASKTKVK